jgi:hypothetical protein
MEHVVIFMCIYVNAIAKKLHDIYNTVFNIKHNLYIASRSVPTPTSILFYSILFYSYSRKPVQYSYRTCHQHNPKYNRVSTI